MKQLIGLECRCIFNLPSIDWPIEGCPAWVVVVDVDMPMICLRSSFAGAPMWVNTSIIKTIEHSPRTYSEEFEKWWTENGEKFGGGIRYKYAAFRAWNRSPA